MIKNASEQFTIDKTIRIEAPQEAVFKLLTDQEQIARWEPMDFFEPRVGGKYQFTKDEHIAFGEVVEFDPPRVVAYTWDWKNSPMGARTVVKFELQKDGEGTIVHFTHVGNPDAEWAGDHSKGWTHYLGRLKTTAEGGDPGPDTLS